MYSLIALYFKWGWIFFCNYVFQYLVERIHTNYALQVRTTDLWWDRYPASKQWNNDGVCVHWTCSDICNCFVSLVRLSQTHFWPTQTHQLHLLPSLCDFFWIDWMRWEVRLLFFRETLIKILNMCYPGFSCVGENEMNWMFSPIWPWNATTV